MIYFTSDLHLGHNNIIKFTNRPFNNVEEMNDVLISNFNSIVGKNDTVYILGDLCYRVKREDANHLVSRLNGKKILIIGNHDINYDHDMFDEITYFKEIKYNKVSFSLMHYPMLSWPHSNHNGVQLHGHIHSSYMDNVNNKNNEIKRYDVGVDANNYYPISIDRIIDFVFERGKTMKKQKWYIQKYDEDGVACKMPREFYGTKRQAKKYAMDHATIIDIIWQRTIKIYSSEEYDIDDIPQKIKIYWY